MKLNRIASFLLCFHCATLATGIANDAAYFIKNVQDGLCITTGPLESSGTPSLLMNGIPITANCSFEQNRQWVITEKEFINHTSRYKLRTFNSKTYNKKLNSLIRGEFINYFSYLVELRPVLSKHHEKPVYAIYDVKSQKCLESVGENHVIFEEGCEDYRTNLSQQWMFILVNQKHAAGTICSSFWMCND